MTKTMKLPTTQEELRDAIREWQGIRIRAGQREAQAMGKHIGRPPKLNEKQIAAMRKARARGMKVTDIAKKFNISHPTVVRLTSEAS